MKHRLRNYFIGKYLGTDDSFERADAIILYQFSLAFFLIFFLQLFAVIHFGFHKAVVKHSIDLVLLGTMPLVIRYVSKLAYAVNYFFFLAFFTTFLATMMLNPESVGGLFVSRVTFFLLMSALLQRGWPRILFCCFFGWLQLVYVLLNIQLDGALTWDWIAEPNARELPAFLPFIPAIIATYAIWKYTKAIGQAKETIFRQKQIIEERNTAITDSIHCAQRIQRAKLPDRKEIYSALPDSFILFKPKDIVSGDFYFFHRLDRLIFIAAADCTGHGVPGALMSMLGFEKLDDALAGSTDPSAVLSRLNKGMKNSLRQTDSTASTRDGMDIALCFINPETRIVTYAGANRPIWVIRSGQRAVEEIKGTKAAIGGLTDDDQHFDMHELTLQQGDSFYLLTDGYADTFGGKKEKKLTTKKFREILLSIQDRSMQEQKAYLTGFIEDWKAKGEQVDDILVIGVRL